MTLADCIAQYEASQATPINARTAGVTPLGHATAALQRLCDTVAGIDLDALDAFSDHAVVEICRSAGAARRAHGA